MMTTSRTAEPPDGDQRREVNESVQTVESVARALRILKCFSAQKPELGVTEVARLLKMHKSTAHRLMVTLARERFIHQVDSGGYVLSWTVAEIATGVAARQGVGKSVLATLKELTKQTGETAHLAVLDDGEVLYVEKVEGTWSLIMPSAVGRRVPLNCTALGKVLLAGLDESDARRMIHGRSWKAPTPNSITDPKRLEREVSAARENGYALDREEIELGLTCVAAPVVDDLGRTCAGMSIAAPSTRVHENLDNYVAAVTKAAADLSLALGPRVRQLSEASARTHNG
jgi:IclR family KDG regulon transcriptional repressor